MKTRPPAPQETTSNNANSTRPVSAPRSSFGLSKTSTTQSINNYGRDIRIAENPPGENWRLIETDLFGRKKFERGACTPVQFARVNLPQDRLIYHPGNGLHLMRINRRVMVALRPGQFITQDEPAHQRPIKANKPHRHLSSNSQREIKKAFGVLWLLAKRRRQTLKFITLTLPTLQAHRDSTIRREALNSFLQVLRHYGMKDYLLISEPQVNGSIHFHIVQTQYFPWENLRRWWNQSIDKLGYIENYRRKFQGLSLEQYSSYRKAQDPGAKDSDIIKAFEYGQRTGWSQPNTTDIHQVRNVRKAGNYMAKYMIKAEMTDSPLDADGRYPLKSRKLKGRRWSRSENISGLNRANWVALDDQTFAIAMEAVSRCAEAGGHVIQEDYRVHIFGQDSMFEHFPKFAVIQRQIINACEPRPPG